MNKRGSTLLELLIYLALFSCVLCLFVPWIVQSHIRSVRVQNTMHHILDCYCALDAWAHDMRSAPSDERLWKRCTPDELIWQGADDVGWRIDNHKMVRYQGTYNSTDQTWTKKQTSCNATAINSLKFTIIRQNKFIDAVHCTLTDNAGKHFTRIVYLHNRVLS